jgi:hypothetical protein
MIVDPMRIIRRKTRIAAQPEYKRRTCDQDHVTDQLGAVILQSGACTPLSSSIRQSDISHRRYMMQVVKRHRRDSSPIPPFPKSRPDFVLETGGGGFWSCEAYLELSVNALEAGGSMRMRTSWGTHGRSPRLSHGVCAMHDCGNSKAGGLWYSLCVCCRKWQWPFTLDTVS